MVGSIKMGPEVRKPRPKFAQFDDHVLPIVIELLAMLLLATV